jgi:hypothetical protein
VKSRIILTALCLVLGPAELAQAAGEQPANPAPAAPADAAPAVPAAAAPAAPAAAAPAAAAPAAAAPAGPPSPAAEMAQLKLFSGNTHCSGKQSASQFGPEHPTQSVVHGRPDLNGFWMTLRYNERKTKENPYPFHALYQIGYDSAAKQYVLVEVDNFGGHATATSSGWDGDKLVFTGDYAFAGGKIVARDTFTKAGDKPAGHLGEIQGSDGNFVTLDEETCRR